MPQITQVQGPLAGFNQGLVDTETVKQAPQETKLLTAQAGEAQLKYQREKMMMDAMQQYGIQGNTPSEKMRFMGNLAIDSGDPEAARKLFDSASLVDSRTEAARTAQLRQQFLGGSVQLRDLDLQGRLLGQATDQRSFDMGNAYYSMITGRMSPYAGMPYSKELANQITQSSMTAKDRLGKALDERKTRSLEQIRADRARDINSQIEFRAKRLALERERLEKLKKAGAGSGVRDPGRDLQTQAMRKIKEAYPELSTNAEALNTAAYDVASEAQSLRYNNRALTTQEALGRALKAAVERGDFKQTPGGMFSRAQTKYTGSGRTAQTAVPLPAGADPSQLQKGHYYIDQGLTAKWDPDDPDAEGGWVYEELEGNTEDEESMLEEKE